MDSELNTKEADDEALRYPWARIFIGAILGSLLYLILLEIVLSWVALPQLALLGTGLCAGLGSHLNSGGARGLWVGVAIAAVAGLLGGLVAGMRWELVPIFGASAENASAMSTFLSTAGTCGTLGFAVGWGTSLLRGRKLLSGDQPIEVNLNDLRGTVSCPSCDSVQTEPVIDPIDDQITGMACNACDARFPVPGLRS